MSRVSLCLVALIVSQTVEGYAQRKRVARPQPRLGINLAGPSDWNTELPLVDVFRFSRDWISQKQGLKWGQGPALKLDKNGWVRELAPDCYAETLICTIQGGHYPSCVPISS
jgi:hypothetical protein